MFIELSEFLRCPAQHDEAFCVVMPVEMVGRRVVRGVIGCSNCRREYPVVQGVAIFGEPATDPAAEPPSVPADISSVQALLNLDTPGGYVVLLGSAARLSVGLSPLLGGIHLVGVNAPADVAPAAHLSLLRGNTAIPLRQSMARGVVVGAEFTTAPWIAEAVRVLLRGLRLVLLTEDATVVGVEEMAKGQKLWVGQKR